MPTNLRPGLSFFGNRFQKWEALIFGDRPIQAVEERQPARTACHIPRYLMFFQIPTPYVHYPFFHR
jgi:hypothetical protein